MSEPMSQSEAQQEAVRRWGERDASVWVSVLGYAGMGQIYCVGIWWRYESGTHWIEKGSGDSWASAFADADRRAGEGKQ